MFKKRTLADLMDNDFFIDFDTTTPKAKVVRKNLNESLKRRRTLTESKLKEGFYDYEYDLSKDKISEKDLYKALVTDGELVSLNAGNTGEMVSFKDGGVYCDTTYEITEYDGKFSVTEFFNSDDGESKEGDYYFETDSFESLCAELEKLFPGALVECKMTEEAEEPDNAVVGCKVNKVIAHSEDEKPVDCLGKKKPLEKPLTEATEENVIYFSKAINDNVSVPAADLDQFKKIDEEVCKIWEDADAAGLIDNGEEEQKLCDRYGIEMFSGVELLDSLTTKADISWEPVDDLDEEIEMTAAELKDKYGTDDVDIINAGKEPKERVALKEAVEVVYAWKIQNDIYDVDWCSVEESDSEPGLYDGVVFLTASKAKNAAVIHLRELEEEGELEGEPSDYYVGAIDYPTGIISDETLEFSNIITEALNELNEGGQTPEAKAWQDANCYKWNAYAVINGKRKSVACTYEPKEINPDTLIASVRRIAAHKLNLIMSECYFLKKPFTWDGNLEITRAEFGAEPEYITTLQIKRQGDRDLSQIPEL